MTRFGVLFGIIAVMAFAGCGDSDPVSSSQEEGITSPAAKLTVSGTKAGGYVGRRTLLRLQQNEARVFNDHDLDQFMLAWLEDGVFDMVPVASPFVGREAIKAYFEAAKEGMPDYWTDPGRVLAAGNIIVVEHSFSGTHLGEWASIPATGNSIVWPHVNIMDYEGDKIARITSYGDNASMMMQLGVLPTAELLPLEPSFVLPDPEPTGLSPLAATKELNARFNSHDLASLAKMFRLDTDVAGNGMVMDRTSYIGAVEHIYLAAHSDLHIELLQTYDMRDGWVVNETLVTGIDDGGHEIFGWPVTGLPIANRLVTLERYDSDGLLTYLHFYYDQMTEMVQLGLVPAP